MIQMDTLLDEEQDEVLDALNLVEASMMDELSYGDGIELTDKVAIYHQPDSEVVVIMLLDDWREVLVVERNDTGGIIYKAI